MINEVDKEQLKIQFGNLMFRRVVVVNMLKEYDKELKSIDKDINDLVDKYCGGQEDGSTVQQAK